jgi:hypothetical protein
MPPRDRKFRPYREAMELPGRDGPDERPDSVGRIDDLLAAGVLPGIDPDQELR